MKHLLLIQLTTPLKDIINYILPCKINAIHLNLQKLHTFISVMRFPPPQQCIQVILSTELVLNVTRAYLTIVCPVSNTTSTHIRKTCLVWLIAKDEHPLVKYSNSKKTSCDKEKN